MDLEFYWTKHSSETIRQIYWTLDCQQHPWWSKLVEKNERHYSSWTSVLIFISGVCVRVHTPHTQTGYEIRTALTGQTWWCVVRLRWVWPLLPSRGGAHTPRWSSSCRGGTRFGRVTACCGSAGRATRAAHSCHVSPAGSTGGVWGAAWGSS